MWIFKYVSKKCWNENDPVLHFYEQPKKVELQLNACDKMEISPAICLEEFSAMPYRTSSTLGCCWFSWHEILASALLNNISVGLLELKTLTWPFQNISSTLLAQLAQHWNCMCALRCCIAVWLTFCWHSCHKFVYWYFPLENYWHNTEFIAQLIIENHPGPSIYSKTSPNHDTTTPMFN